MSAAEIRSRVNVLKITHLHIGMPWAKSNTSFVLTLIAGPLRRKHTHCNHLKIKLKIKSSGTHGNDKMFRFAFHFPSFKVTAQSKQHAYALCLFHLSRMNQCNWWLVRHACMCISCVWGRDRVGMLNKRHSLQKVNVTWWCYFFFY